ncbi:MAG: hypothetical protein LBV49_12925, partial [Azonexus sp.]|nr:hypothetical protein [Azonexus sp.]
MFLWRLAKMAAVGILIALLISSITALAAEKWGWIALCAPFAILCFFLADYADRRLDNLRWEREKKRTAASANWRENHLLDDLQIQKEKIQAETGFDQKLNQRLDDLYERMAQKRILERIGDSWTGDELLAGMRWLRWLWRMVILILLLLLALALLGSPKFQLLMSGLILLPLCAFLLLNHLWLAWRATRAGYVLRLSASDGLSHCLGPSIAWQDIYGVCQATTEHETQGMKLGKFHRLILKINAPALEILCRPYLRRLCNGFFFRINEFKSRLFISCNLIAA